MAQHRTTTSGSRGTKIVKETGLDGSSTDVGGKGIGGIKGDMKGSIGDLSSSIAGARVGGEK